MEAKQKTIEKEGEWKYIHAHRNAEYVVVTPNVWGGPFDSPRNKWNCSKYPSEKAAIQSLENSIHKNDSYDKIRKLGKVMPLKEFESTIKHDKIEITTDFYEIHKSNSDRINDYYIPVIEKFNALYEGLDFTGIITKQSGIWFY